MIDPGQFVIGLIAVNQAAHQAEKTTERDSWYCVKCVMMSAALEWMPKGKIWLNYELGAGGADLSLRVGFTTPRPGAFHVPYSELSGTAKLIVADRIGNPDAFKRFGGVHRVDGKETLRATRRRRGRAGCAGR
jgi:hypothetical protein